MKELKLIIRTLQTRTIPSTPILQHNAPSSQHLHKPTPNLKPTHSPSRPSPSNLNTLPNPPDHPLLIQIINLPLTLRTIITVPDNPRFELDSVMNMISTIYQRRTCREARSTRTCAGDG